MYVCMYVLVLIGDILFSMYQNPREHETEASSSQVNCCLGQSIIICTFQIGIGTGTLGIGTLGPSTPDFDGVHL
jgi:hypothetical protein